MPARLGILFATVIVDLLGFGIVIPLLPFYAERFGADGADVGLLYAAFPAAQLVLAPVWGRVSDRVGRRPVLLASLCGSAAAFLIYASARSLPWLFLARIIGGAAGATVPTAQAYIADSTSGEERARGMGFLGAAFGVGFILGPAVGGALSSFSPRAPFLFGAAVAAVNLVLAFARLPETRPAGAPAERPRATLGALKDPQFAPLYALGFLATFAFSNMESTLALLVARRHGFDARAAGMLFAYVGVLLVLMQGVVVGRLARRFGEARLIVAGTLLMAAGLFCAPHAPTVALLCAVLALLAFGSGLFNPSLSSLVSRRAAAAERGGALGLLQSMVAAARVVGPASAGFLFEHRGTEWPYLVGGAVMLLACVLGAGVLLRRTI